ncbi:hypothetical protein OIU76_023445 [Salix suchowensis]|nr:hypothetical protein OIU76_023445 [Salix suchowensis]
MRVHMDCAGCESKVKNALEKVKGVDGIDIDMGLQKVTITGMGLTVKKVLKTVRKTGKKGLSSAITLQSTSIIAFSDHYYNQHQVNGPLTHYAPPPASSYNYYKHGYDSNDHGYYRHPVHSSIFNHQSGAVFSDENPHGCSVM